MNADNKDQIAVETTDYEIRKHIIPVFMDKNVMDMKPDNLVKTTFLDMGVIFKSIIGHSQKGKSTITIPIRKDFIRKQGLTVKDLYEEAMQNMRDFLPIEIMGITDAIADILEEDAPESPLYVASNSYKQFGASEIFKSDEAEDFCYKVGCRGFFILPSSIHETMLLTDEDAARLCMPVEAMKEMVIQANEESVRPEERLSESVYHYDLRGRKYTIAIS